jgi:hypothetical protein
MGWHYILRFSCKVKPEYIDFVRGRYLYELCDERDDPLYLPDGEAERAYVLEDAEASEKERKMAYAAMPKAWRDVLDIWFGTGLGQHFQEYNLDETTGVFSCEISKKVTWHRGDLRDAYLKFLKDVVVHISDVILDCEIESDDYGDVRWRYTDSELRNVVFRLGDKIKTVFHTYDHDGAIIESCVVYKYPVPAHQHLDLVRAYGQK